MCCHPTLLVPLLQWQDPHGKARQWESAERTTRAACGVDAVAIISRLHSKAPTTPDRIAIITQYRPPVFSSCLELPAGLIDAGEDAGTAAVREMREETGYCAQLVEVSPVCVSDPGMSGANMQVAMVSRACLACVYIYSICLQPICLQLSCLSTQVDVDLEAPENVAVVPALEEGEFISVDLAPWDGLLEWLVARREAEGVEVDARLMAFAMGLAKQDKAASSLGTSGTGPSSSFGLSQAGSNAAQGAFGSPLPEGLVGSPPPKRESQGSSATGKQGGGMDVGAALAAGRDFLGDGKFLIGGVAAVLALSLIKAVMARH